MNEGAFQFPDPSAISWGLDEVETFSDPLSEAKKHFAEGKIDEADSVCLRLIRDDASNAFALHQKAQIEMERKEWASAIDWLHRTTLANDRIVSAWTDLGKCASQLGKWADATLAFQHALELEPDSAVAHYECGLSMVKQGKLDEAIDAFRLSAGFDNSTPEAYIQVAECYFKKRELEDCLGAAQRALQVSNRSARAYDVYGRALAALGQTKEAISAYKAAIKLDPMFAEGYAHIAKAYLELGQPAQALEGAIQAVQLSPDLTIAQVSRASALRQLGHVDEAMVACHKAILTHVNIPEVHMVLGLVYLDSGLPDEAAKAFERGLAIEAQNMALHSNLLVARQHSSKSGVPEVLAESKAWFDKFGTARYASPERKKTVNRIGVLCGDLCDGPDGRFALALAQGLKENAKEIYFYAYGREDDFTLRLQDAGYWRSITGLDDETASTIIAEDGVDALIDLTGFREGNRFGILLQRPCARQIGWLGHFGPYNTDCIDAMIGDPMLTPASSDELAQCPIMRLPHHAYSFSPLPEAGEPGELPCEKGEPFTFGAVCSSRNINRKVISAWSEILKSVPGSRLIIKAKGLNSTAIRKQFINWFNSHGVSPERILTFGKTSWSSHIAIFDKIDLCLDTFPCSGLGNTFESAWMGVPTITCAGKAAWERGGTSVMQALGLDDFVSESEDAYIALAVKLASQRNTLSHLRPKLRSMISESPLCDARQFANDLVTALEGMKERKSASPFDEAD